MGWMRYFSPSKVILQANTHLLLASFLCAVASSISCARSPQPAQVDDMRTGNPGADTPTNDGLQPVAVRTVPVHTGNLQARARYLGQVRPVRRATVLARSAGTLVELPHGEGEYVRARQPVARINAPDASARLARVRAELSRAQAERDFLCERHASDRALGEAGALPPNAVTLAAKNCAVAQHAATAVSAQLHEVELAHARSLEVAPFDGRIVRWMAEPGEEVMPGRPLLSIEDSTHEVVVALSESDLARGLGMGSRARLSLRDGQTLDSQLTDLSIDVSGPGRTREASIPLPAGFGDIWSGMSVDVDFILAEAPDATAVPRDALQQDATGHVIFVVLGDHIKRLPVTPGLASGGWVAVTPAPQPGARVVVGAPAGLYDGQRVFAVADPAGAQPTTDPGVTP